MRFRLISELIDLFIASKHAENELYEKIVAWWMIRAPHLYIGPRKDKRGVNLISDALPFWLL